MDYLYGKYSGKSALDKKIQNTEEILNQNKKIQEDNLERIFDQENLIRLKAMNVKDMTFNDLEIYNEIRKKYDNIGKDFSGNDFPQPVGSIPDVSGLYSKILSNLKQILEIRGYQVYLKPMKSLIDVRDNIFAIRDSLKQNNEPVNTETGYDEIEFKGYGDVFAKQDIRQSEFVIDYDIPDIASKGDVVVLKSDKSWERRPKYTKEELIRVKQEVESMLRAHT